MFDLIFDAIVDFCCWIVDLVVTFINGVIDFFKDVVGWFKKLTLKKGRSVPWIADGSKFKDAIKDAPTILVGIFDEVEDKVTQCEGITPDALDETTTEILKKNPIAILN